MGRKARWHLMCYQNLNASRKYFKIYVRQIDDMRYSNTNNVYHYTEQLTDMEFFRKLFSGEETKSCTNFKRMWKPHVIAIFQSLSSRISPTRLLNIWINVFSPSQFINILILLTLPIKISQFVLRIKQMNRNFSNMKNKVLQTCLQGNYRASLGEFSNTTYGVFGAR